MKTTQHNLTLLALLSLLIPVTASPATWRVEKDGSGDYTVIQDAVDAAAVGDTILIGPGRYEEKAPFTTDGLTEDAYVAVSTDSLTIRGTDREGVIIGPTVQDFTTWGPRGIIVSRELTSFVRIEKLSVENTRDGVVIYGSGTVDSVTATRCRLGVVTLYSTAVRVRRSTMQESSSAGLAVFVGATGVLVQECLFTDNLVGADLAQAQDVKVQDCTFRNGGLTFEQGTSGSIEHCQFDSGANGIIISLGSTATVDHCGVATTDLNLQVSSGSHAVLRNTTLHGGGYATIRFSSNSTADFHNNHILKGTGPSVLCEAYVTDPVQIDLTGNYWGTTSADSIRAWILDGNDLHDPPLFPNYSEVLFEPFAQQPIPTEKTSVGGFKSRY